MLQDEATQVNGVIMLGDYTDMGITHAKHMDRAFAKLVTTVLQVCIIVYLSFNFWIVQNDTYVSR